MAANLGFGSNPYLDKSVADSLGDTTRAWNMTAQPAFNSAMVKSGSFGNSGVDQMNQYGAQQLQTSLGRQANDMRSQNYQFGQNLGFAQDQFNKNFGLANEQFDKSIYDTSFQQGQQQFGNAMNVLGLMNQGNTQNLGVGTQIQNTPMNYYTGFNQQANSIGQGYGTSNMTSSAQGSPLFGALGGAQLGSLFAKGFGGGDESWRNTGSGMPPGYTP